MKKLKILLPSIIFILLLISLYYLYLYYYENNNLKKRVNILSNRALRYKELSEIKEYQPRCIVHGVKAYIVKNNDQKLIATEPGECTISESVLKHGEWEPHLNRFFEKIIKPGFKVLSFGGHIGIHSFKISNLIGMDGKIIIFEPNPKSLELLEINMKLSDYNNYQIIPKAAFSENKILDFIQFIPNKDGLYRPYGTSGESYIKEINPRKSDENFYKIIKVEAVKPDSILSSESFDILQMDVEGAEIDAVFGSKEIIDNSPNLVVIQEWDPEFIKDKSKIELYINFWKTRGYDVAILNKDSTIEKLAYEELYSIPHSDIILSKNIDI